MRSGVVARLMLTLSTTLILGMGFSTPAEARRTAIDFDETNIAIDGQSFSTNTDKCATTDTAPSSCRINIFGDQSYGPINLGFTIKIGTTLYSAIFVNEAGIVTFGSAIPGGSFQAAADLAELQTLFTQPFIALFYRNLQIPDGTAPSDPFTVTNGGAMFGRGSADPVTPFNTAGLVPALHVGFVEDTFDPGAVATQVVIYFTGNTTDADATNDGDFNFRIRYGFNDGQVYNTVDTQQGVTAFSLGSGADSLSLGAPVRADDDYLFKFHNGHLVTSGSNPFKLIPAMGSDYGAQALLTSKNRNYTLTNTGTLPLSIGSISITGIDATSFSLTNTCGTSLAASKKCNIAISFRPTTAGAKSANLEVVAGGNPVATRFLKGVGVKAVFTVTPTSLAFGNVPRNTVSAPKTVTVRNTGTVAMPINSIGLAGTSPAQFTQTGNCPSSLATGATCAVTVKFKPTSTGAKSATLVVTPGGGAAVKSVPLTGTGT